MTSCFKRTLETVDGTDQELQLVIPKSNSKDVLPQLHGEASREHLGTKKKVHEWFH